MAYLTFLRHGVEIGRCPLEGPVVIGRASDCHVCVHDISLSRHHCRIQPTDSGDWLLIDLNSKNGTRHGRERVSRLLLRDGYDFTVGKTTVQFQVGDLPDLVMPKGPLGKRPVDPYEVLAGTVTDFDASVIVETQPKSNYRSRLPTPKPAPPIPAAYGRDDVQGLLTEIASSSWDSIYATASRPRRPLPERVGTMPVRNVLPIARPRDPRPEYSLEARPARREFTPPTPVRPSRPARPTPQRGRGLLSRTLMGVGRAVRRWVAPPGAIRLL